MVGEHGPKLSPTGTGCDCGNIECALRAGQILKADGTVKALIPERDDKSFTLEQLQKVVGGFIEIVHLNDKVIMVVNEEGLCNGLPLNFHASRVARQPIVGDVLVCWDDQIK